MASTQVSRLASLEDSRTPQPASPARGPSKGRFSIAASSAGSAGSGSCRTEWSPLGLAGRKLAGASPLGQSSLFSPALFMAPEENWSQDTHPHIHVHRTHSLLTSELHVWEQVPGGQPPPGQDSTLGLPRVNAEPAREPARRLTDPTSTRGAACNSLLTPPGGGRTPRLRICGCASDARGVSSARAHLSGSLTGTRRWRRPWFAG